MPNSIHSTDVLITEYEETDEDLLEDFTFTLSSDGSLKSFAVPQHLIDDLPDEVCQILEMFGIEDLQELNNKIIH